MERKLQGFVMRAESQKVSLLQKNGMVTRDRCAALRQSSIAAGDLSTCAAIVGANFSGSTLEQEETIRGNF
jgi:hypothetical protein